MRHIRSANLGSKPERLQSQELLEFVPNEQRLSRFPSAARQLLSI